MARIVLAHGFTQTGASWEAVAAQLRGEGHEVRAPDLPGHGGAAAVPPGLRTGARRLGEDGGPAIYAGYSMGGRYCLHLALDRPELVHALVLAGATPGIDDPGERAERREADAVLAAEIERDGVDVFLEKWLAQPLFVSLPRDAAAIDSRRVNTAAGLAASLRDAGTGAQDSLWPRLAELRMPVVLVTGSLDAKFTAIAERMAAAIGTNARHVVVAGSGHAVPLERPAEFAALVAEVAAAVDAAT